MGNGCSSVDIQGREVQRISGSRRHLCCIIGCVNRIGDKTGTGRTSGTGGTGRSCWTGRTFGARSTRRARSALGTGWTGRTSRTFGARSTRCALGTGRTGGTCCAGSTRCARSALGTGRTGRTSRAVYLCATVDFVLRCAESLLYCLVLNPSNHTARFPCAPAFAGTRRQN